MAETDFAKGTISDATDGGDGLDLAQPVQAHLIPATFNEPAAVHTYARALDSDSIPSENFIEPDGCIPSAAMRHIEPVGLETV